MQKKITKEDVKKALMAAGVVGATAVAWRLGELNMLIHVVEAMNHVTKEAVLTDGRIVDFDGYLGELIKVLKVSGY